MRAMRRSSILSCLALLFGCSSETPAGPADAATADDTPVLDAPATPDAPVVTDARTDVAADGGPACGAAWGTRCNLISGAGCAAGQGCYLVNGATGMAALCRAAGSAGWDEPCMSPTDCREGFLCVAPGRCAKLCCDDDSQCNDESRGGRAGARCMSMLTDGRGLKLCVGDAGCDPFVTSNNRCPAATPRCNPAGDNTVCGPFAMGCATPAAEGAPCCDGACCGVGLLCVGPQSREMCLAAPTPTSTCRRTCNLRVANPDAQCPMGQRCTMFSAMSSLPTYFGYCAPAM